MSQRIISREARFVVHLPSRDGLPDLHYIKTQNHLEDGTVVPGSFLLKDYKRDFYITKPHFQNHKQHKEWEDLECLTKFTCTQSELCKAVAKAIGKPWSNEQLRQLRSNPYIYGTDISSSALIKKTYLEKNNNVETAYTVAGFDVETDVVHGTNEILMATISFKNKVFTAIQKKFVENIIDPVSRIDVLMDKYLGDLSKQLSLESETVICDQEIDVLRTCINKAHEWKPDFLAIWNMDFDVQRALEVCARAEVDPKDIFCDPIVPEPFRYFKYLQGPKKKVTVSGKVTPINPSSQWHTVICPSSFYIIDPMCSYKRIRLNKQEEPSYSLDAILKKHKLGGKLTFEEADQYDGLKWHQFMQVNYKLEYVVYNRYDTLSMLLLDTLTKDLSHTISSMVTASEFRDFKSQPKLIADAMHFFCLENNKVFGSAPPTEKIKEEDDAEIDDDSDNDEIDQISPESFKTLSLKDWIVTLPAHMSAETGIRCIEEDPTMVTNIRALVADIDCTSSYPSDVLACNVSKETTRREIIGIKDIDETVFRMENINALSGHTNAVAYCSTMFNFPTLLEVQKDFKKYLEERNMVI